jgi:hypothetical protein
MGSRWLHGGVIYYVGMVDFWHRHPRLARMFRREPTIRRGKMLLIVKNGAGWRTEFDVVQTIEKVAA